MIRRLLRKWLSYREHEFHREEVNALMEIIGRQHRDLEDIREAVLGDVTAEEALRAIALVAFR